MRRRHRVQIALTGALGLLAVGVTAAAADQRAAPGHGLGVSIATDQASVTQYQDVGVTIEVANRGDQAVGGVALTDQLPAGVNLSWAVDHQHGITGCGVSGAVGSQRVDCPRANLVVGQSFSVHLYSHTTSSTADRIRDVATVTGGNQSASASVWLSVRPPADCRSQGVDGNRTLAFDDEFDGNAIDTSKWNVGVLPFGGYKGSTHYHNTQYGSYIQAQNSVVHNGELDLITNNVPVTDPDVAAIGTIPYTEGMIHTKDKFSRTGGYFEICAKFPAGKGLWPAFWLAAQSGNWPPEMDVAEWFGSLEALQIGQPFATGPNAGSQWLSTWRYSAAPTTGFHDYAMWWSTSGPSTIRYYIDGQMVHEVDGTTATTISDTPMYLILNSGTWAPSTRGGPPDATTVFPNAFQVDYARVYTTPPPQQANSAP